MREGFEPSVQFNPYDGLANRSFRPLRHLTVPLCGDAKVNKVLKSPKDSFTFFKISNFRYMKNAGLRNPAFFNELCSLELHGGELYFLLQFDHAIAEIIIRIH